MYLFEREVVLFISILGDRMEAELVLSVSQRNLPYQVPIIDFYYSTFC